MLDQDSIISEVCHHNAFAGRRHKTVQKFREVGVEQTQAGESRSDGAVGRELCRVRLCRSQGARGLRNSEMCGPLSLGTPIQAKRFA